MMTSPLLALLAAVGLCSAQAPPTAEPSEHGPNITDMYVMKIEFMAENDLAAYGFANLQTKIQENAALVIYQAPHTLNLGKPVSEATLCLWVYLKNRRYTNTIAEMTTKNITGDDFRYVSLGVYSSAFFVQTEVCTIHYDYFVELRKWIHICVIFTDRIKAYIDKVVVNPDIGCVFNGTESLTSSRGVLFFGSSCFLGEPMSGMVADARLYLQALSAAEVRAVRRFSNSPQYIELIEFPAPGTSEPAATDISLQRADKLTQIPSEFCWMQMTDLLAQEDAENVCDKFGGHLLDASSVNKDDMNYYAFEVIKEPLSDFWAKSPNKSCLYMTISPGGIDFKYTSNCSTQRRSICSVLRNYNYSVILTDVTGENHRTSVTNLENTFIWDAEYNQRLEYRESESTVYLMNSMTKEIYAKTTYVSRKNLMGRKVYTMMQYGTPLILTLTSCKEDQFTCSNGKCIDLQKTCDFIPDCPDFTDEQLCNYTRHRPSYYDRELSGRPTLQVELDVELLRILQLDMEEGTLEVNLKALAYWRDHRVDFHNIHYKVPALVPNKDATFYWQPNIELSGVIHEDNMKFSMAEAPDKMYITAQKPGVPSTYGGIEVLRYEGVDVIIKHEKTEIITLMCPLDLFNYPFDIQTCNVTFTLEGKINPDAEWTSVADAELQYSGAELQLFEHIHFKRRSNAADTKSMTFEMRIARRYGSHILVTFLPCVVLQLIGLSVFAIPLDDLANRLTISISCLIVMAALFTQISSTLPVSADPKMIDTWMFMHVLLLAVVFFAMLALNVVRVNLYPEDSKADRWSIKISKVHPESAEGSSEEEEPEDDTFAHKINKWTAIVSVVFYLGFVVVVFLYIATTRAQALGKG